MGYARPAEIAMRRRWKLVLLLAVGCALLGVSAYTLLRPPGPPARINPVVFEQIEKGMTPAEVEVLIGLRPGDYRANAASPRHRAELLPKKDTRILEWEADDCNIQVRVDEHTNRVVSKVCGEPLPSPFRAFLEQGRAWAGW
jgi:hypothetical protein